MMQKEFPDVIPPGYQEKYGLKRLRDQEKPVIDAQDREAAQRWAESSVQKVKRLIFPIHGIA